MAKITPFARSVAPKAAGSQRVQGECGEWPAGEPDGEHTSDARPGSGRTEPGPAGIVGQLRGVGGPSDGERIETRPLAGADLKGVELDGDRVTGGGGAHRPVPDHEHPGGVATIDGGDRQVDGVLEHVGHGAGGEERPGKGRQVGFQIARRVVVGLQRTHAGTPPPPHNEALCWYRQGAFDSEGPRAFSARRHRRRPLAKLSAVPHLHPNGTLGRQRRHGFSRPGATAP